MTRRRMGILGWSGLVLLLAGCYAWFTIFSRALSVDEGYLMISVRSFLEGNPPYDSIFTQYGPVYYVYEWVLHGVLGIPLTHDATRLLCILHWLAAALALGLAGGVLVRSFLVGALIFMQAVVHLALVANEPGHPQEIISLLLGIGVLLAILNPNKPPRWAGLAMVAALLGLIKINVGIFFGFALCLVWLAHSENFLSRGPLKWIMIVGPALLPLVLMRRHLGMEWCLTYGITGVCTIVATLAVVMNGKRPRDPVAFKQVARPVLGFAIPTALFLGISLAGGSTWAGLLDGLLLTPLRTPDVALLPIPALAYKFLPLTIVSMFLAITYAVSPAMASRTRIWVALKLVFGMAGIFLLVGKPAQQLGILMPWVWLVLIPTAAEKGGPSFGRTFLGMSATWQMLQAYPIGGTQVALATVLLVPAYVLCVFDAVAELNGMPEVAKRLEPFAGGLKPRLVAVLAGVALIYLFANLWCDLPNLRRYYASLPLLNLRGSHLVRTDAEQAEIHREVSRYLEENCDTFITYPGVNSFYFWAGKNPPTHLNSTGWGLLSLSQQERIIAAVRRAKHPRILVIAGAKASWKNGAPAPILPLVRFVLDECREIKRIGDFVIHELNNAPVDSPKLRTLPGS